MGRYKNLFCCQPKNLYKSDSNSKELFLFEYFYQKDFKLKYFFE